MYTKGPWEATPGKIVIGKRVRNGSMDLICDLRGSPYINDIPYNSLLISAAPDLLEACKLACDFYDRLALSPLAGAAKYGPDYNPPTDEDCLEVRNMLENAISKAEGSES